MWDDLADQYIEQHYKIEEDIKIAPEDGPGEAVELAAPIVAPSDAR